MTLSRRSFLIRSASVLAAPAVLTLGVHMPVRAVQYSTAIDDALSLNPCPPPEYPWLGDFMVDKITGKCVGAYYGSGKILTTKSVIFAETGQVDNYISYDPKLHRRATHADFGGTASTNLWS